MANLYELTEQAAQLYELLQEEVIDEETFGDTLESLDIGSKIADYCYVIRQLEADRDMFKTELERLSKRRKSAENGIERMKGALTHYMLKTGSERLKNGRFTITLSQSKALEVSNLESVPKEYRIPQEDKVDKLMVKQALAEGIDVPGVELVINKGVRIR